MDNCTDIGPGCSVEDTIYGYYPNLGSSVFFIAIFALIALIQLGLGFKKRTYFYSIAIALGCIGEAIGYGGRLMMHDNPYSDIGFKIQISCLIVAPAFVAAGIYLTLKHLILAFGQERSYFQARFYTWIFITCDVISLTLQGIGGGFAGGAGDDEKLRDLGTNLMISGIVQQVATLIAFAYLVTDYAVRTRFAWEAVDPEAKALLAQRKFKGFLAAVMIAYWTVFFRCVYRIAEMVGGWANPIMRDEISFIIMEGVMIVVAVLVMTLFHPGYCFPRKASLVKTGSIEYTGSDRVAQHGQEKISSSAM
ncbi:related to phospholipid-translocating ATPase [Rhynchosporium secalis]|uniref:Related to phospholipid-translocating ATPase n=1 Tax=Rhynchosporium secalis TaxID=38038 RepID=A0A1E1MB91_RHYSE|nr:related to phospholipid-translocating ATPase [Rhynchosporium secalis]